MAVTRFFVLTCLVVFAVAEDKEEVAITHPCDDVDNSACTIGEVRINPCKPKQNCLFTKGKNVTMNFDFTPNFSASTLMTGAYYNDIPFAELGNDACGLTPCPAVAGVQQQYTYNLYVGTKLPTGRFPIIWKVWNRDNDKEVCCFKTTIRLRKNPNKNAQ